MIPHADKVGDTIILILWMRTTDNTPRVVQETWRLDRFRYLPLNKLGVWIRTLIYVPLSPGDNSFVPSSKNCCTIDNANRNRNVNELCVVNYKRTSKRSVAGVWSLNENGSILNNGIDDGLGTSSLFIGCELKKKTKQKWRMYLGCPSQASSHNIEAHLKSGISLRITKGLATTYRAIVELDTLICPALIIHQ